MENNNEVKVWVVVRQGTVRRTLERVEISARNYPKWAGVETYTIFPSKRAALAWINRWNNAEDFDFYQTRISLI